jgi:RNA polymerase-binding transcription factor
MDTIKHELEQKRQALTEAIRTDRSRGAAERDSLLRELTKDPYGSASLIHDDEIGADVVARRMRELRAVNQALDDLEAGRYGTCQECGEPIAKARLRALPFATRCVACQAALEVGSRAA